MSDSALTLSVQARDRAGNLFARQIATSADEALAIFQSWIALDPGLTVEVVGVYA